MKVIIFYLITTLFITQCVAQTGSAAEDFKKLNWLTGGWQRTNVKPGKLAFERWTVTSNNELSGSGTTTNGMDTIVQERLKLILKDNNIYYVAVSIFNNKANFIHLFL